MAGPITTNPKEVAHLFRDMGIVGAGGAGFPAYFKYLRPTPILIVNCEEGEPGYEGDKLLLRTYTDQFKEVLDALKSIFKFQRIVIGAKEKDKEMLDALSKSHGFELAYSPSTYGYGEERWLTKAVTGKEIQGRDLPASVGVTVSNVETLYNMYLALFQNKPVIDKYLNVYGEVAKPTVFCAPVGTFSIDLLCQAGIDTSRHHHLMLIDGGPMMGDLADVSLHALLKKTNGLLVVDKAKYVADQVAFKQLPGQAPPTWEDTLPRIMEKLGLLKYLKWHPNTIHDVRDQIERVRLYLNHAITPIAKASIPVVRAGDKVKRGQLVAKPIDGAIEDIKTLSVALHASLDGVVKEVTDTYIVLQKV